MKQKKYFICKVNSDKYLLTEKGVEFERGLALELGGKYEVEILHTVAMVSGYRTIPGKKHPAREVITTDGKTYYAFADNSLLSL